MTASIIDQYYAIARSEALELQRERERRALAIAQKNHLDRINEDLMIEIEQVRLFYPLSRTLHKKTQRTIQMIEQHSESDETRHLFGNSHTAKNIILNNLLSGLPEDNTLYDYIKMLAPPVIDEENEVFHFEQLKNAFDKYHAFHAEKLPHILFTIHSSADLDTENITFLELLESIMTICKSLAEENEANADILIQDIYDLLIFDVNSTWEKKFADFLLNYNILTDENKQSLNTSIPKRYQQAGNLISHIGGGLLRFFQPAPPNTNVAAEEDMNAAPENIQGICRIV